MFHLLFWQSSSQMFFTFNIFAFIYLFSVYSGDLKWITQLCVLLYLFRRLDKFEAVFLILSIFKGTARRNYRFNSFLFFIFLGFLFDLEHSFCFLLYFDWVFFYFWGIWLKQDLIRAIVFCLNFRFKSFLQCITSTGNSSYWLVVHVLHSGLKSIFQIMISVFCKNLKQFPT